MRVLITGGAGFVGANLAAAFRAEAPAHEVVAFDNLRASDWLLLGLQRVGGWRPG